MKMLKIEARENKAPLYDVISFNGALEFLQEQVGGYIEVVSIEVGTEYFDIVLNEEGKLLDLPYSMAFVKDDEIIDLLAGNLLIMKTNDEGEFVGIDDMDIQLIRDNLVKTQVVIGEAILPTYSWN